MSGKRRTPVGRGYMPKGGVAAAQAHNAEWRRSEPSHEDPQPERPTAGRGAGARERAGAAAPDVAPPARPLSTAAAVALGAGVGAVVALGTEVVAMVVTR